MNESSTINIKLNKQNLDQLIQNVIEKGTLLTFTELETLRPLISSENEMIKRKATSLLIHNALNPSVDPELKTPLITLKNSKFELNFDNGDFFEKLPLFEFCQFFDNNGSKIFELNFEKIKNILEKKIFENFPINYGKIIFTEHQANIATKEVNSQEEENSLIKNIQFMSYDLSEGETDSEDSSNMSNCSIEEQGPDENFPSLSPQEIKFFSPQPRRKLNFQQKNEKKINFTEEKQNIFEERNSDLEKISQELKQEDKRLENEKREARKLKMKKFTERFSLNLKKDFSSIKPSIFSKYKKEEASEVSSIRSHKTLPVSKQPRRFMIKKRKITRRRIQSVSRHKNNDTNQKNIDMKQRRKLKLFKPKKVKINFPILKSEQSTSTNSMSMKLGSSMRKKRVRLFQPLFTSQKKKSQKKSRFSSKTPTANNGMKSKNKGKTVLKNFNGFVLMRKQNERKDLDFFSEKIIRTDVNIFQERRTKYDVYEPKAKGFYMKKRKIRKF